MHLLTELQEEEKKGGKKGRLLGVITLSDVLRYVIGDIGIGESVEPSETNTPAPQTPAARDDDRSHELSIPQVIARAATPEPST